MKTLFLRLNIVFLQRYHAIFSGSFFGRYVEQGLQIGQKGEIYFITYIITGCLLRFWVVSKRISIVMTLMYLFILLALTLYLIIKRILYYNSVLHTDYRIP